MSDLPQKWARCMIGEVADIVGGGTPPSKDPTNFTEEGGIPWITPSDLSGYKKIYISRGSRNLTEKGLRESSARLIPAGSVLFSSRAPIGYIAIAANELSTNQGFKCFILPEELDSHFIYFYLRNIKQTAEAMATGTTFKELSGAKAARLPLLIAPLNEQKRIANKLEGLLERVDACQNHLERIPKILEQFRQSVLAAATSGKLTEEWREGNGLSLQDWEKSEFDKVCTEITVGYVGKMASEYREDGIPFLRSLNIKPFRFDSKNLKYISREFHNKIKKSALRPGDVVVVRSGAPGKCCVIPSELPESNCSDLVIVRTGSKLLPDFASILINSEVSQSFVRSEQVGVAQQHFNVSSMKKAPISLPTLVEQREVIRRVQYLFSVAARLESHFQYSLAVVEKITTSLLVKAFHGELVEQDPDDESALFLLERIKTERAKTQKEKRKPHRRATMKSTNAKKNGKRIGIVRALQEAGGELSTEQLFYSAGYQADADSELVEDFLVEIREALKKHPIQKRRFNDTDWFTLIQQ